MSECEALGDAQAQRPAARRVEVSYEMLAVGDFMTVEESPHARWVEVVDIQETLVADDVEDPDPERVSMKLAVTFRTPQSSGAGTRWVIERRPSESVVIDANARSERLAAIGLSYEDFFAA